MRVHHLNCGSHCPVGGAIYDGHSHGLLADIPTHCLLIETDSDGLVLVDTGYGTRDVAQPYPRLPHAWRALLNIRLRQGDTALHHVQALGFEARDVRHIVLTHLDFDHAGGIEDFPSARVHVLAEEKAAAVRRRGFVGRQRYRPLQWDDAPDWRTYARQGEPWFGFDAVRRLDGLPSEILMLPLRGHTLGHAGVAIEAEAGWMLHAGDAYLHHGAMAERPWMPPGLAVYQAIMDTDRPARRANQARLRDLKRGGDVRIFCSHDAGELAALQDG